MEYDDQSRRFNLVTGLACGAALGAGVAFFLVMRRGADQPLRPLESGVRGMRRRLDDMGEEMRDVVESGRARLSEQLAELRSR